MNRDRLLLVVLFVALGLYGAVLPARATGGDSLALSLQPAAADTVSLKLPSAVVEGHQFEVDAQGNAYDGNDVIDATYKRAGGSCAATSAADSGTNFASLIAAGTAPYDVPLGSLVLDRGNDLICAWLYDAQTGQTFARTSASVNVAALNVSFGLRVAHAVDAQATVPINIRATLPAGVAVGAVADILVRHRSTVCAANPAKEPTTTPIVVNEQLTDTRQPTGSVRTQYGRATLQPGRYLVCAWLLNGWDNSSNPSTVAGPMSLAITAFAPRTYAGRSSQGRRLSFVVARVSKQILQLVYNDRLSCSGTARFVSGQRWNGDWSSMYDANTFGALQPGRSGKFKLRLNGNPNHTFDMTARLVGKRIRGTFNEQGKVYAFTYNDGQSFGCHTGRISFSARTK